MWRLALARLIAPVYAKHRKVVAVGLGGSVSRGYADRSSDIEIGVFWAEPPTDDERMEAFEQAGGTQQRLFAYDPQLEEWTEDYAVHTVKIDVVHRTYASTERHLADVTQRCDIALPKQGLICAIQHMVPLHGATTLERWQARTAIYPDELARAMVAAHLMFGPHAFLELLAERNDFLPLYEIVCRAQKQVLLVLSGLNRVYLPHTRFKWIGHLLRELRIAPPDLALRLEQMFGAPPPTAVAQLGHIIDETLALVELHMPEIDTATVRAQVNQQRAVWEHPPTAALLLQERGDK
jgi:hypothetical protein